MPKKASISDRIAQQKAADFIGREDQLTKFRINLELPAESNDRKIVFNIYGQGGVGKSTFVKKMIGLAEQQKAVTVYLDLASSEDTEISARPEHKDQLRIMRSVVEKLKGYEKSFKAFSGRFREHQQHMQNLQSDTKSRGQFAEFFGESLTRAAFQIAKSTPVAPLTGILNEDPIVAQVGKWAKFVESKIRNKEEAQLVINSIRVLTSLFVNGLNTLTDNHSVVLFFDTYEVAGEGLDSWLRALLKGDFGGLFGNLTLVITGRKELNMIHWVELEGIVTRFPLEPFTESETKDYLDQKGITAPEIVKEIGRLSNYLPLWVATLASQQPKSITDIKNMSAPIVERFLQWTEDPLQKRLALDASLPRILNRDIIAQLSEPDAADNLFEWLQKTPFVSESNGKWVYHSMMRDLMARYKRQTTPEGWMKLHEKIAEYYSKQSEPLAASGENIVKNKEWQELTLELIFHKLCSNPALNLPIKINEIVMWKFDDEDFAIHCAESLLQAGEFLENIGLKEWGTRLKEGLSASSEDKHDERIKLCNDLITYTPLEPAIRCMVYLMRAESYRLLDQLDNAMADFSKAIELNPANSDAYSVRGMIFRKKGNYSAALLDFNRAIELGFGKVRKELIYGFRGLTYRLLNQDDEAFKDLARAIEINPKSAWALNQRALIYKEMEQFDQALADLTKCIEIDEKDSSAYSERAIIYSTTKQYDNALADFTQAIKLDEKYAWAYAQRGTAYRMMGQHFREALSDLNRAIELDDKAAWVYTERGSLHRMFGNREEATADLTQAIKLDNQSAFAFANRGANYKLMGRYEDALNDLTQAIQLDPNYGWAYDCRIETYQAMRQFEAALADISQSIAIELNEGVGNSYHLNQRGDIYLELDRYEEAAVDYTKSLELLIGAYAYGNRGRCYLLLERFEEALTDFDRAIEIEPEYTYAYGNRGIAYRLTDNYEKSLNDFNRAIELDQENDWWFYERALLYRRIKNIDESKADLSEAIRIADTKYEENKLEWNNALNLALYFLANGQISEANEIYTQAKAQADISWIRMAVGDLKEYLSVLPDQDQAREIFDDFERVLNQ